MKNKNENLQWVMVIMVLVGVIFMSVKNNQPEIMYNLAMICFGFYFGSQTPDIPKAA